jgi:hypothetical protein
MNKVRVVILGVLLICSCKKYESNTATTDTTATTATTATTDTTSTAPVTPVKFRLDHFKFWRVRPGIAPVSRTVQLRGQFDSAPWKAEVNFPQFIGNPADKNHEGIQNPLLHYVAYGIKADQQPSRTVAVTNQFVTDEKWRLGQPSWLLVPADKKVKGGGDPTEPPKGDHFVCYAVEDAKAFGKEVTLLDQFDKTNPEQLRELKPAFFCVPVEKTREGKQPEPIIDRETHLAVYWIDPQRDISITISTNDQFGRQLMQALRSEYLGVPSLKRVVQ